MFRHSIGFLFSKRRTLDSVEDPGDVSRCFGTDGRTHAEGRDNGDLPKNRRRSEEGMFESVSLKFLNNSNPRGGDDEETPRVKLNRQFATRVDGGGLF